VAPPGEGGDGSHLHDKEPEKAAAARRSAAPNETGPSGEPKLARQAAGAPQRFRTTPPSGNGRGAWLKL
jgi:hypothetical protein